MSEVFIITGTPGSGKSTVANALMQKFEFGFHIPIDDLREWVVSGIAHPLPEWTTETTRQFDLGYQATVQLARLYASHEFAVAIDQVIYPKDVKKYFEAGLAEFQLHKIFLRPNLGVALARNATRTNKDFDTAFLNEPLKAIYQSLDDQIQADDSWIIVDSTDQSISTTVEEIFQRTRPS